MALKYYFYVPVLVSCIFVHSTFIGIIVHCTFHFGLRRCMNRAVSMNSYSVTIRSDNGTSYNALQTASGYKRSLFTCVPGFYLAFWMLFLFSLANNFIYYFNTLSSRIV